MDERKKTATAEAKPFKEVATKKGQEASQWKERLKELKKAKQKDDDAIADSEQQVTSLTKEAKEAAGKAKEIENAVYDLKAVNPIDPCIDN